MTGPEIPGHAWVRALGTGGFAEVHLYRQASPARDVAVKVLRVAGDDAGRAALAREADALAAAGGHPAVVALYASGVTGDGRPYLAMEYCPVSNLSEQARSQPLAVARALELMVPVAAAAETLHRHGLVHRDIKPANLMLTAWDRPVLADFGAAWPVGADPDGGGGFSPLWAAPEQQVGAPAHPTQDVWALAATAWTLLAGRSPFGGEDNSAAAVAARVQSGRLPALGRPDAPASLEAALRAALVVEPRLRTPSAREFAEQLRAVQTDLHVVPTPLALRAEAPHGTVQAVDDNRTRARSLPVLEPDGPDPALTLPASGRGTSEGVDGPPQRPGMRPWVVVLLVVVAALVTAGAVLAGLLGGGGVRPVGPSTPAAVQPQDPVRAPPAQVAGLAGTLREGRVYWTWQRAEEDGVRYVFTITRPGAADVTRSTALTGVDVAARPGSNCIEVSVTSEDGRESAPVSNCVSA